MFRVFCGSFLCSLKTIHELHERTNYTKFLSLIFFKAIICLASEEHEYRSEIE